MAQRIPFVDLQAQYKELKKEINTAISEVIQKTQFIQGQAVEDFEENYAIYIGAKYSVGLNSGTDALILGIRALGLKEGEIIVPVNTYYSGALAVLENNLKVVFVDIDEKDFGINLEDLQRKITKKTKAILVTHLYGQADKITEIQNIVEKINNKILLIEDACQSHGAFYKKKKVGTYGVFSAFSFYPGKNLGAYGDAGALTTNDSTLVKKLKYLREYGQEKKYIHTSIGVNSRLDTIQAAVLLAKLPHLDFWNKSRQQLAEYYTNLLRKNVPFVKTPNTFSERLSVYHLYVIHAPKRDQLLSYLQNSNIFAQMHYPLPLHLQKAFSFMGYKKGDFPFAEKISSEIISLPIYPQMTKAMVARVADTIEKFYRTV